ncbi:MAG: amidohydrolase family protein [Actinomycetota bacterium]
MGSRADHKVIDAWVQPWTKEVVAGMPERNWALVDNYGGAERLRGGIPTETMIEEMDAAGVDLALCSAGPLIPVPIVEDAVSRYPDRLIGVGSADPWGPDGVMVAVRELKRQVLEKGFKALKLEPFIDRKDPTEAGWYPLYAACVELDVTLQIQVGNTGPPTYPSSTGRPLHVDQIAVHFPELRIVAGHIGWPWTEEMIAIAWKHPNVWIDTSAHLPKHFPPEFVRFLKAFGQDKVIWATDWPIVDFERSLTQLDDLDLKPEVRRKFLHDNAVAAFKLG